MLSEPTPSPKYNLIKHTSKISSYGFIIILLTIRSFFSQDKKGITQEEHSTIQKRHLGKETHNKHLETSLTNSKRELGELLKIFDLQTFHACLPSELNNCLISTPICDLLIIHLDQKLILLSFNCQGHCNLIYQTRKQNYSDVPGVMIATPKSNENLPKTKLISI